MKILLFGLTGQVGSALMRALKGVHELVTPDLDITNEAALTDALNTHRADIIINAAAYTNVDGAEDNSEIAFQINARAPHIMAMTAKEHGSLLIHYSTDYVFDGTGQTPWRESDSPAPLNQYGRSKYQGDQMITQSGCRHLILRTSWVYSVTGDNFIQKMINLSEQKDHLQIVSDQIGAPTSARFIATATAHAIERGDITGLFHLCCSGETSWYEYARLIIENLNPASQCKITPILSKDYPQKALRPLNSRLNCDLFRERFNISPPDWKAECLDNFATIGISQQKHSS